MLLLLTSMIGLGLIAGYFLRGSLKGLKELHFRVVWTLFVSLLIALLPLFSDAINRHRRVLQLVAFAGVLIFLVVNTLTLRGEIRVGMLVIGLGWALNFIVIAANGGMPLSRWAYAASGQTAKITAGRAGFYRIVEGGPHTKLYRLGDVLPLKAYHEVLSIGDVLMMLGIVLVIAAGMRLARREHKPLEQPAQ